MRLGGGSRYVRGMNAQPPQIPEHYPPQVQRALQKLDAAGAKRAMSAPPLYRLFWRLGWDVAPPVLASFATNVLTTGLWFGAGWGLAMWLLFWRTTGMTGATMVAAGLLAGLLFGVCMALLLRYQRQRLGLPLWSEINH